MLKSIIGLVIFLLLTSCGKGKSQKFINNYSNENFDEFADYHLFMRGVDGEADPIIGVAQLSSRVKQVYFVTIQRESAKIKKTNYDQLLEPRIVDTQEMKNLAIRFLKYGVNNLTVDSNRKVSVRLYENKDEILVKYADESKVGNQCEKVKGNWYLCH